MLFALLRALSPTGRTTSRWSIFWYAAALLPESRNFGATSLFGNTVILCCIEITLGMTPQLSTHQSERIKRKLSQQCRKMHLCSLVKKAVCFCFVETCRWRKREKQESKSEHLKLAQSFFRYFSTWAQKMKKEYE